jgi:hypothetical protein
LQRNKKLAHKIERSQTTKKRKGQKKTYLNPRGENETIGLAKGRGKKNRKPTKVEQGLELGFIQLKSIFHVWRCFQYKVKNP